MADRNVKSFSTKEMPPFFLILPEWYRKKIGISKNHYTFAFQFELKVENHLTHIKNVARHPRLEGNGMPLKVNPPKRFCRRPRL